jgi:hypothetical protein
MRPFFSAYLAAYSRVKNMIRATSRKVPVKNIAESRSKMNKNYTVETI